MRSVRDGRFALAASFIGYVRRQPMLGREEELSLARRSRSGDAAASARLIASHLRFVIRLARNYRGFGLPMADLVQEGTIGLIHAVRRFNPERDARLSTYAMWWIRASMQEYVVRSWSLVRVSTTAAQKALFLNLRKLKDDVLEGADALSDDMAERLSKRFGVPVRDVFSMARRAAGSDWSLNARPGEQAKEEWLDRMPDERANPEEALATKSEGRFWRDLLGRAMDSLSPREQVIIRKRYLDEVKATFAVLAGELGLSKERVRQLEAVALAKLKFAMIPDRGKNDLPA